MVAEKNSAFGESWNAMALQALQSQRAFAAALARSPRRRRGRRAPSPPRSALAAQLQQAALAVLGKGLAPVHRRAVANAKRLARTTPALSRRRAMRNPALLYPMFALAAWTLLVLLLIPVARARSARRREIVIDDFKYGESAAVPPPSPSRTATT